jgi:hypothetical protein
MVNSQQDPDKHRHPIANYAPLVPTVAPVVLLDVRYVQVVITPACICQITAYHAQFVVQYFLKPLANALLDLQQILLYAHVIQATLALDPSALRVIQDITRTHYLTQTVWPATAVPIPLDMP